MSPGAKKLYYTGVALILLGLIPLALAIFSGNHLPRAWTWVIPGILVTGALLMGLAKPVARPPGYYERLSWCWVVTLGLACVIGLSFGGWNLWEGHSSLSWPRCDGVVVSSTVTRHSGRGGTSYTADVSYRFGPAGTTYTASRVSFPDRSFDTTWKAQTVLDRYPVGKRVFVSYLTDNPARAVLEPGISGETWWAPGLGVVSGSIALFIIFSKRRRKNKKGAYWWAV